MSLLSKVKMSPSEDRKNGDTTKDEQQGNQSLGSHAKVIRKTDETKRSQCHTGLEQAASKTTFEKIQATRRIGFDLEAARQKKQ